MGPDTIDFANVVAVLDGTQIVYAGDGERVGRLRMIDSFVVAGKYGFMGPKGSNATAWDAWTETLEVRGNTFAGAERAMRKNLPDNTYVDRDAFDGLIAARLR
jgi:hypothetical protein